MQSHRNAVRLLATITATLAVGGVRAADTIDYNRHIRPLLSNHCFKCHGPDAAERKGGFRLDLRESALAAADSGERPVVPGNPASSELIRRIQATDPSVQMPPAEENKPLSDAQKQLLSDWIAAGAKYQSHWSFVPPARPPLPATTNKAWPLGQLDTFVLARLEREGWQPSAAAERSTLQRRLALDLTGLPPALDDLDTLTSPDGLERYADKLLSSPRFGERLALDWLDAARFADTHGYHIDSGRDMSRWREGVIASFNRNQPYDRFVLEQLAGDLLPETGHAEQDLAQKIASGFNRNHMINFEGGAIPEEYLTAYIVDRVNTTGTVFLGLTVGCAQCHDHKYDPLTQREYYQLYAFFNNLPESGLDGKKGNADPLIRFSSPEFDRQVAALEAEIKQVEDQVAAVTDDPDGPPNVEAVKTLKDRLALLKRRQNQLEATRPTAMVMQEMPQGRETFVLARGAYDKRGDKVSADVPGFLPPLPAGTRNRQALAEWLLSPDQPLTARVTVNRYWQMFFGTGLVRTAEDFGSQGELPSHPELLDWLAAEFTGHDTLTRRASEGVASSNVWNVKRLIRHIVTSATYRQSSNVTPALRTKDPENRLLARGPRFRLQAEFIRDQALALSGLLDSRIGGRSVSPYQPPGLWEELMSRADGDNWTAQKYEPSHGVDLYRRTMYTFWKRTCPPPTLTTLDAPDRETCIVRRSRTNTPLQALVLMNDPTYVEAARLFAERIVRDGGVALDDRIRFAFRSVTARLPSAAESAVLQQLFANQLATFKDSPTAASGLLAVGEYPADSTLDRAELAAWTMVASAILNADEALTKG